MPATRPVAADPASGVSRRRFDVRQLVIVGVVCALVGAAIPISLHTAERSAAAASEDQLRTAALRYLDAIAAGDSEAATRLAPPIGAAQIAPSAVLRSATPIERQEVELVRVDGDVGVVQVRYRIRVSEFSRLLDAAAVDGEWQITTSLAEPLMLMTDGVTPASIAGVELSGPSSLLLYPGSYALDLIEGPVHTVGGNAFVVDGMPGSPSVTPTAEVSQAILDQATERALSHAASCVASGACGWPATAVPTVAAPAYSFDSQASRLVFVQVPLKIVQGGATSQEVQVQVVMVMDEGGAVVDASCSGLTGFGEEAVPCEP